MRILIVGAGALGGYFGARLLAAGRDVTFLVRPRTAALLAANGLVLTSPLGDLTPPPPPLPNGMAHMDALDARFGRSHVLGGATIISAVRDANGRIRHLNRLHTLHF